MDEGTELSDAIRAVRVGLAAAQQAGDGLPIRFSVKEITLDFGIEIRHSGSAAGGVKAFVVSADTKGERSASRAHRLTVSLLVHGGEDTLINDYQSGFGPTSTELPS
ncbi:MULTISPECIES: trypco2 family protein [Streptomyces violaceusniger group]|nr:MULTISPECIES: trypco2 family protein [Streptomyces violaceusniger group]